MVYWTENPDARLCEWQKITVFGRRVVFTELKYDWFYLFCAVSMIDEHHKYPHIISDSLLQQWPTIAPLPGTFCKNRQNWIQHKMYETCWIHFQPNLRIPQASVIRAPSRWWTQLPRGRRNVNPAKAPPCWRSGATPRLLSKILLKIKYSPP